MVKLRMRPLALSLAVLCGAAEPAWAIHYTATTLIGGHTGPLPWNYPGSNTWVYLAPQFDTPQYQALYNGLSPAPTGFGDTTTVGVAPLSNGVQFGEYTVAIRGTGAYSFAITEPGTTLSTFPTNYDLMAILYVAPGAKDPFNPANLYSNLVALSDDALLFSANPDPLFYVNNSSGCVTMSLIYFSWAGVTNASATINVNGPGQVATSCGALGVLDSVDAERNRVARNAAIVIDAAPALLNLFANLSGDAQRSAAVTQTLPLLTGSSTLATAAALSSMDHVVGMRMDDERGLPTGERFDVDHNLWVKPFGSWALQDDHAGVSGYKADTSGAVFGGDSEVRGPLHLGAAFGYAHSDVSSSLEGAPHGDGIELAELIGYGYYALDSRTALNFQVDAGVNHDHGTRAIPFMDVSAQSAFDSTSQHVGIGLERSYALDARTTLTPQITADYLALQESGYSEQGAGILDLAVNRRQYRETVLGTGVQLAQMLSDRWTLITSVGAGYNRSNRQSETTAAYAGAPSSPFATYGITPGWWQGHVGLGAVYQMRHDVSVTARFDTDASDGYLNRTASMHLNWSF